MTPPCYEASLPGITTSDSLRCLDSSGDPRLQATTLDNLRSEADQGYRTTASEKEEY